MVYEVSTSSSAKQARDRYEASLEVLRKALAGFPLISQQLGAQEERLAELEKRVAGLRQDIDVFERSADHDAAPLPKVADAFPKLSASPQPAHRGFQPSAFMEAVAKPEPPLFQQTSAVFTAKDTDIFERSADYDAAPAPKVADAFPKLSAHHGYQPGAFMDVVAKVAEAAEPPCHQHSTAVISMSDDDDDEVTTPQVVRTGTAAPVRAEIVDSSDSDDDIMQIASLSSGDEQPAKAQSQSPLPRSGLKQRAEEGSVSRPSNSVSFGDDEELAMEVRHFSVKEFECNKPAHGHWLPTTVMDKRASFLEAPAFGKLIGGRTASLPTGSDIGLTLDCVLVEPQGKVLSPDDSKSPGLVICIQSQPYLSEDDKEWGQVLQKTKWLDAGFSVCFPDLWRGSGFEVEDLHIWLDSVLSRVGAERCVLMGKGWGGQLAVQLAHSVAGSSKIVGLILVAPGHLPSEASNHLQVPTMLVWAVDDEVSPYDEYARDWVRTLEAWRAPTAMRRVSSGGHELHHICQDARASVGETLLHFCVAVFLIESFERWIERTQVLEDAPPMDDRILLLLEELPSHLAAQLCSGLDLRKDSPGALSQAVRKELSEQRGPSRAKEKVRVLRNWISSGLERMASSTE